MSQRIRILGPESPHACAGPFAGYGVRLFIDDKEITDVSSVDLRIRPDEIAQLTVGLYLPSDCEIELSAEVKASIAPLDAGVVIEVAPQGPNKRYRIVKPEEATKV